MRTCCPYRVMLWTRSSPPPPLDSYYEFYSRTCFCCRKFGQCEHNQTQLCEIADYLKKKIESSSQYSPYTAIWWKLLAQLYIARPNLTFWDDVLSTSENDNGNSLVMSLMKNTISVNLTVVIADTAVSKFFTSPIRWRSDTSVHLWSVRP